MQIKPFTIFAITFGVIAAVIITAVFLAHSPSNSVSPTPPPQKIEQSVTLNETIRNAMTVYVTVPYHKYANEELRQYFTGEIADNILKNYEPFDSQNEEKLIEFEEQPYPDVKVVNIQFDNGEYAVKLQFGEVYYNYRLTVTPNRIITKIIDGGITFE